MENKKHAQVVDELDALKGNQWRGMRFHPALEQAFRGDHSRGYRPMVPQAGILAVFFLLGGVILEWLLQLDIPLLCQIIRGIAVACVILSSLYVARSRHARYHGPILLLNGVLCSLVLLAFAYLTHPPIKHLYYSALFMVQVFVFAFLRLPFNLSVLAGLLVFITGTAVITIDPMPLSERVLMQFFMLAGTMLALAVCHRLEKHEREAFLRHELVVIEREQLRQANRKLHDRLASDPVTHLANRRSFEETLLDYLERPQRGELIVAVVWIEGFKSINDALGDEVGDDLLRSVARSLSATLGGAPELASRVGGGRFAALWCCDSLQEAERRLDRLQGLLQSARVLKDSRLRGVAAQVVAGFWVAGEEGLDPRQYVDVAFARCQRKTSERVSNS